MGRFRELVDIEEKMRILILLSDLPYDLVLLVKSQLHVFVSLWLIPDSSVPRVCLHLILATPLSPTFNGWMIIQRRLSFLGIWAGEFPLLIFAPL